MKKIAVIGASEFVLGFQLAGVKQVFEATKDNIQKVLKDIRKNIDIGIAVVDESLMETMDKHERMEIEASASPVFVSLSTKSSQDNLRYLIKKSIGVDLMQ